MASIVLGSTTVISESSGTASIADGVNFPAGHVLQQKRIVDSTYTSNSTTSYNTIFSGIQITNVTSGSKVIIQACIAHLVEGTGQGAFRIIRASDSTVLAHSQHSTGGNGSWRAIMPTIIAEDTTPSVGTNNYTLQMKSSGTTIYYNYHNATHEGTRSFYLLTEVTQ